MVHTRGGTIRCFHPEPTSPGPLRPGRLSGGRRTRLLASCSRRIGHLENRADFDHLVSREVGLHKNFPFDLA
jgi:hypothetical protein